MKQCRKCGNSDIKLTLIEYKGKRFANCTWCGYSWKTKDKILLDRFEHIQAGKEGK